jgi:general secretion pathway protein D
VRISELFRLRFWSAGMFAVAIVGNCAFPALGQSPPAAGSGQQTTSAVDKLESWLRDAQTAMQQQKWDAADSYLRVAEALTKTAGASTPEVQARLQKMRDEVNTMRGNAATLSPSATQTTPAAQTMPGSDGDQQLLLEARQALARGDVAMAQSKMLQAKQSNVDFNALGDSPDQIQAMIATQNELAEMARKGDAESYNSRAAIFLLDQGQRLLSYGDVTTAEFLINQAEKFPVDFAKLKVSPSTLRDQIKLAANKKAPSRELSAVTSLMAQAQLAVDQKNWTEAKRLVTEARGYNLPETDFAANAVRPWQLEMIIDRAMKQTAMVPKGDIKTVSADSQMPKDDQVVSANYDSSQDKTQNMKASHQQIGSGVAAATPADNTETAPAKPQAGSEEIDLSNIKDEEQLLFRKLQQDTFRGRADADRLMKTDPRKALDKMVALRTSITSSELSQASMAPLLTIVDRDITEMQRFIQANLSQIQIDEQNSDRLEDVDLTRQRRYEAELQIQELAETANKFLDQGKYSEAQDIAMQIKELAPESDVASALQATIQLKSNRMAMEEMKEIGAQANFERLADAERSGIPAVSDYEFGDAEAWIRNSTARREQAEARRFNSESDRRIWNKLKNQKIQGDFIGSLRDAVSQIANQSGENIVFDTLAMTAEGIEPSTAQVNAQISQPISMESALKVLLGNAGLTFVVEDEVIKVTSNDAQYKRVFPKTYYIGDLVTPVTAPNSTAPSQMNFITPVPQMNTQNATLANVGTPQNGMSAAQAALAQQLPGFAGPNGMSNAAMMGALNDGNSGGAQRGVPIYTTMGAPQMGGITIGDFQPLMQLITQTIAPDEWQTTQGEGTIQPYVPNLSLIVSQTQEVHDEIQDLLTQLRKLNDVQIVVEVRFITLRDNFFERVGIDFDFKINDNSGLTQAVVNNTDKFNPSVIVGRDPTIDRFVPTADLDVGFNQGSLGGVLPTFGGFDAGTAANFGFAILSDIEVFFLITASKGDTRTNLSTAPTVTMFNGQSASVSDFSARPFVTSVIPIVGDFAVAQQPVVSLIPDGTTLNVRATASDDRRFISLALNPYFTKITDVKTFTFDGSKTTRQTSASFLQDLLNQANPNNPNKTKGPDVETVTQGVTVQQPVVSITTVNTVVSIPDGGTVLIGGVKELREARLEKGVPFLSNLPYVNRLFKNVGIGRETANLMMMVTPRIIIQEEEERRQVGPVGGGN